MSIGITASTRRAIDAATPAALAWCATAVAAATIAGAWVFEAFGYAPCDLCLQQRWAYYAGVPLAAAGALLVGVPLRAGALVLGLVASIFAASAIFGAWHAGVEWGFWPGPAGCTGASSGRAADMGDFMRQMEATRLVRCDEVAIRILGLSLAGWNALISLGIAGLAVVASRRAMRA